MNDTSAWPSLPQDAWRDTYPTLHMWTQIVGKICLALMPPINHYWGLTLHICSRGLVTPSMPYQGRALTITFDFIAHQLVFQVTDGTVETISLEPRTVADFYRLVGSTMRRMNMDVHIWPMPVEIPNPIRFDQDVTHRSYDKEAANAFWRILVAIKPVFETFRSKFIGKTSPLHFFWGHFDLALTRFSGRRAPEWPGADVITKEAYSHEVISHGFWPGSGSLQEPAFYAYAAPESDGYKNATVLPAATSYSTEFSNFILLYEAVRTAANPESDLMAFLMSTYSAAADLAKWNRSELERS